MNILDRLDELEREATERAWNRAKEGTWNRLTQARRDEAWAATQAGYELECVARNHLRALINVARAARDYQYGEATLREMREALAPLLAEEDGQTLSSGYAMDARARKWAREAEARLTEAERDSYAGALGRKWMERACLAEERLQAAEAREAALREALRKISSGVHLVDHFYAGECGGECARQLARVALAAGREEA